MTERPGIWQAMVRTHRPLKEGTRLLLDARSRVGPEGRIEIEETRALVVLGYARPGRAIVASENSGAAIPRTSTTLSARTELSRCRTTSIAR